MAVFVVYTLKLNDHRILFKCKDKIEFVSKSFSSRVECLRMVRLMRRICHNDFIYNIKNLSCGSWCFEFIDPNNNDVLGRSKSYTDKITVMNKISHMKANAHRAKLEKA